MKLITLFFIDEGDVGKVGLLAVLIVVVIVGKCIIAVIKGVVTKISVNKISYLLSSPMNTYSPISVFFLRGSSCSSTIKLYSGWI